MADQVSGIPGGVGRVALVEVAPEVAGAGEDEECGCGGEEEVLLAVEADLTVAPEARDRATSVGDRGEQQRRDRDDHRPGGAGQVARSQHQARGEHGHGRDQRQQSRGREPHPAHLVGQVTQVPLGRGEAVDRVQDQDRRHEEPEPDQPGSGEPGGPSGHEAT